MAGAASPEPRLPPFWPSLAGSCSRELAAAATTGPREAGVGVGGQEADEAEEGSPADGDRAALCLCEPVEGAESAPPDSVLPPAFPVVTRGEDAVVCALTMVAASTCDEFAFQRFWRASALHAAHRQLPWQAGQI